MPAMTVASWRPQSTARERANHTRVDPSTERDAVRPASFAADGIAESPKLKASAAHGPQRTTRISHKPTAHRACVAHAARGRAHTRGGGTSMDFGVLTRAPPALAHAQRPRPIHSTVRHYRHHGWPRRRRHAPRGPPARRASHKPERAREQSARAAASRTRARVRPAHAPPDRRRAARARATTRSHTRREPPPLAPLDIPARVGLGAGRDRRSRTVHRG